MTRSFQDRDVRRVLSGPRPIWILLSTSLVVVLFSVSSSRAQVPGRDLTDSNLTDTERRESTLLWLSTFLTESDLLRDEDVVKIRQAVAQMSPSQLERWLEQTKQLRSYVESEKWQQTKRWLREFMRVQAIYSEPEIQDLRDQIIRADADQMLAILKRIQAKYDSLLWMQQSSERNRQVEVQLRDERVAQQTEMASAARAAAATTPPAVGSTGNAGGGTKPSKGYQVPGPLINSREMARAAVWSELWGPGWLIGF